MMSEKSIEVVGARTHNLKNISANIPLGKLTVITGVSGSGKSSLAFDTLYAEGQRRYVESLSTYARQFIEKMARPDVDHVRNVQPAIAIEQKNSVKNARSTIGTATEVNDYLRLLYAKAGVTICPYDLVEVHEDNPQSVAAEILRHLNGERLYLVAPLEKSAAISPESLRQELVRAGFSRLYLAGLPTGERPILDLDEAGAEQLSGAFENGRVRVLIDRLRAQDSEYERIASSVAVAFQAGHGTVEVFPEAGEPQTYHSGFRCNVCGRSFARPEPNLFSFNTPLGACSECSGFGRVTGIDWEKVIPNRSLTLEQHPVVPFNTPKYKKNYRWVLRESSREDIPSDVPLDQFTKQQWHNLLYGVGSFEGIKGFFDWLEQERYKVQNRILVARYRGFTPCPKCEGTRLVPEARHVVWAPANGSLPKRNIAELTAMSIKDLLAQLEPVRLSEAEEGLYGRIFREILSRLTYLVRVGLGYLTLDRQTRTLSGGEAQRINLATALGTALTQTLYVLDEPTVGLHARDSRRLLEILRDLRDNGNTIVVVEHDPELILGADELLDLGPRAGSHGGEIVFAGPPSKLSTDGSKSLTAKYLGGRAAQPAEAAAESPKAKPARRTRRPASEAAASVSGDQIVIVGAREHNLKNLTVAIPLHRWVCLSGVSGSGKSTLLHRILFEGYNHARHQATEELGKFDKIVGLEQLDEMVLIDQSPIGRSIRSNPVTYVKAYDPIRKLFAATREARSVGLTESSFSFNVSGGRCERCEGTGVVTYDMHFLAEMTLPCDVCDGRRFTPRVLEVRYRDLNISQVLGLTVDDATEFFCDQKTIIRRLAPLRDVGLGYLTLGQNTSTLSGGEAQRLKLASYLTAETDGRRTMMIFDEPTTGLHLADLDVLSGVFRRLVERGFSLVIIEHNLEILRQADWVIDLGPEGGDQGGYLLAQGPPATVAREERSYTGRYLKELL